MKSTRIDLIAVSLFVFGLGLTSAPLMADNTKPIDSGHRVFQIVHENASSPILFDQNDADVVGLCAKAFAKDIALVTGITPDLHTSLPADVKEVIIIGTLGKSKRIDHLVKSGKISKEAIEGQWERFLIQIVDHPLNGVDKGLVIAGSDPRGTAFGVFDLSKRIGVSPWVYWADVRPARQKDLCVSIDKMVSTPPLGQVSRHLY
jgi:hypothetical protein